MEITDVLITPAYGMKKTKAAVTLKLDGVSIGEIRITRANTEYFVTLPSINSIDWRLRDSLRKRVVRKAVKEAVVNEYILFMIERTSASLAVCLERKADSFEAPFMYAGLAHL